MRSPTITKKLAVAIFPIVGMVTFCCGTIFAYEIQDSPIFYLPNNNSNPPIVFPTYRVVADGYGYIMGYRVNNQTTEVINGPVFTIEPASVSLSHPDYDLTSAIDVNPGSFETKAYHKAEATTGNNPYTDSYNSAFSQVWNWYVLSGGNPGQQVTLAADVLVQGGAFADGGNNYDVRGHSGTIFGVSLGVLTSPDDLVQDYIMRCYGTVGYEGGLVEKNTFGNLDFLYWPMSGDTQEINYIIRSQPFTVTVGVPFRLSLYTAVQGYADPYYDPNNLGPNVEGWATAWSDFYDPRIVTSSDFPGIENLTPDGFSIVLEEGGYTTLGQSGYSIASAVPEPSSIMLLGCGLGVLVTFGRRLKTLSSSPRRG